MTIFAGVFGCAHQIAPKSPPRPSPRENRAAPACASAAIGLRAFARFVAQSLGERQIPLAVRGQAIRAQAELGKAAELARQRLRRRERLARRDDAIGEAEGERLVGADSAAGEDHVERPALADEARQAH